MRQRGRSGCAGAASPSDVDRVGPARRALDEEAVAQAWAEGKALSLDEAVAYALTGTAD